MTKVIEEEICRGIAEAQLERVFGAEWIKLKRGRKEVLEDFIEAAQTKNLSAEEYYRRIYRGNLQRYANCLLDQKTR